MLIRLSRTAAAVLAGALLGSCSDTALAPTRAIAPTVASLNSAPPPSVRFSEIHYDNTSVDANEAVEISGPAGTSLDGWRVVPYNGANGLLYSAFAFGVGVTIPETCGARGVVTVPILGLQN